MNLYQPTITGSLSVSGSVNISGSISIAGGGTISGTASIATTALTASSADNFLTRGTLTAQTLVVQTITSSVDFVTGSTRFGSTGSNTHVFTGSMNLTGSLTVTTTGTELQVNASGVNLGNALTDSHIISGSLTVNPNGLFVSSSGLSIFGGTSTTSANPTVVMQNRLGTVLSVAGFNWAGTTTDNNSINSLMIIGGYLNTSAQTVATANTAAGMQFFNGGFYWYGNTGLTPGSVYTNTQRMFLTSGGNLIIGSGGDGGFRLDVSGTARLTGALTATSATFSGNVEININQNSLTRLLIRNTTAGTGAYVETSFQVDPSGGAGAVGKYSSSTNAYKIIPASSTYLYNSGAGDISILNDFSSGAIRLAAGGSSTSHLTIASTGAATFSSSVRISSFTSIENSGGVDTNLSNNATYDGTNWKYIASQEAARYLMNRNTHQFFIAPAGTTGNNITFTQAMTINSGGNVLLASDRIFGINTSDGSDTGYLALCGASGDGSGRGGHIYLSGNERAADSGTAVISAGNVSGGAVIFRTGADIERMRITSGGVVNIGLTSGINLGERFNVIAYSLSSPTLSRFYVNVSGALSTSAARFDKFDNNSTTSQVFIDFTINNQNTANGSITANGANQATFTSWSDRRLKENITNLPSQLSNIMALRPVEFDYKDGSGHQIGFIAQEVQEVYSDIVGENAEGYLTISGLGKMESRLIKAIQELKAEFDEYKATHP